MEDLGAKPTFVSGLPLTKAAYLLNERDRQIRSVQPRIPRDVALSGGKASSSASLPDAALSAPPSLATSCLSEGARLAGLTPRSSALPAAIVEVQVSTPSLADASEQPTLRMLADVLDVDRDYPFAVASRLA